MTLLHRSNLTSSADAVLSPEASHAVFNEGDNGTSKSSLRELAAEAFADYRRQIKSLTPSKRPRLRARQVRIPKWLLAELNDHVAAVVLSQLLYWLRAPAVDGKSRAHAPEPDRGLHHHWIAKTATELADETGLKIKTVQKAMIQLRRDKWIGYHPMKFTGQGDLRHKTVSHVWIAEHGDQRLQAAEDAAEAAEAAGESPLAVWLDRWAMAAVDGCLTAGLVLSRIWHLVTRRGVDGWFDSRPSGNGDPNGRWIVATTAELADGLMLSESQIKRAVARLRSMELIQSSRRRFGRGVPNRFTVDLSQCLPLVVYFRARGSETRLLESESSNAH